MRQIIHQPLRLRIPTLLTLFLCAVAGAWGQTTYKLEQVTSVEAGGLYVFEQTYNDKSYVMSNSIASSPANSLKTTSSYNVKGLLGTESYVWTLESAKSGDFYFKNNSNQYLNNVSSTDLSLGSKNSIWAFNFQIDNTVIIQNTSNGNRFLGFYYYGGERKTVYKAYEPGTINASNYLHAIKVFKLVEETSATVTLNASGYATFASTSALDFTDVESNGYSAWQITGISGTTITFEQITGAVEAGTGVFLKGTVSSSIEIPYANSAGGTLPDNKLVGITAATDVPADTYYGLKGNEFVKVNAGTVPAGKALLPTSVVDGLNVKSLSFMFDSTDGVDRLTPDPSPEREEMIFNLAGQRLSRPQRGINIIGGKKVYVSCGLGWQ